MLRKAIFGTLLAISLVALPLQQPNALIGCRQVNYNCSWYVNDCPCQYRASAIAYYCEDGTYFVTVGPCCSCG